MRITAPSAPWRGRHARPRRAPSIALLALCWSFAVPLFSNCAPGKGTIGAVIAQDESSGRLFLRDVPEGLAAAHAELKAGDEILLIDGLDVRTMDPKQIHGVLVGEVDSTVKLTLIRNEQVLRVTLKRTQARRILKHAAKTKSGE